MQLIVNVLKIKFAVWKDFWHRVYVRCMYVSTTLDVALMMMLSFTLVCSWPGDWYQKTLSSKMSYMMSLQK